MIVRMYLKSTKQMMRDYIRAVCQLNGKVGLVKKNLTCEKPTRILPAQVSSLPPFLELPHILP